MSEANKALVRRFIEEYQCGRDESVALEITADDYVDHTPYEPGQTDKQGVLAGHRSLFDAFPDLRFDVVQQFADGDKVITQKTISGTHLAEFEGVPATGKSVRFDYADIVTVRDGQVTEHWMFLDRLELMSQIGVDLTSSS